VGSGMVTVSRKDARLGSQEDGTGKHETAPRAQLGDGLPNGCSLPRPGIAVCPRVPLMP